MGRAAFLMSLVVIAVPSVRSVSPAPPAPPPPLVDVLQAKLAEHNLPALGAVTLRGSEIKEIAVAGVKRRGGTSPVRERHFWHLGSCTKAMTATLVARLVEKDEMRWDMTIGEVLADERDAMRPEYRDVTIEQLLQNRGGLPGKSLYGTALWQRTWQRPGPPMEQRRLFVADVLSLPPEVPVGEFLYSNQGFAVAGHMCERVSGVPYERLMQREVFGPLQMKHAGFGAPGERASGHPVGHKSDGAPADPKRDNPPAIAPAGAVHAPLEDWAKFVAAHLAGPRGGSELLSAGSFERLHAPLESGSKRYALGWGVARRRWGGTVLNHAGSNTMWYCVAWVSPDRGLAFLVTCNQGGDVAAKACDEVASALIDRALQAGWSAPASPPPTPEGLGSGRPDPP